jgi:8-amino-7-oxononanoate synthase
MSALHTRIKRSLESRAERQILRTLTPIIDASSPQPLVDFSSNDYLSFAQSPLLRTKLLDALTKLSPSPYGPPSSRLLDGNSDLHLGLEQQLAAFFRADSALLFNSGFDANVGVWSSLPDAQDFIIYDELIHASTHDGMRGSRVPKAHRRSFKHNDVNDLERILSELVEAEEGVRNGVCSVWVTAETLYSMDGDLAPLESIVETVEELLPRGNGLLVVDEVRF